MVKISKARTKFIKSLQLKKYRQLEQTFLVEGEKSVLETLNSDFIIQELYASLDFITRHEAALTDRPFVEVSASDLNAISSLKSNRDALALVTMKPNQSIQLDSGLNIAVDNLNDPGNFGTIIRIADWYGAKGIIASDTTAELYNPKVISASKGSFTRVPVEYCNLQEKLNRSSLPVFAADMRGEEVHSITFPNDLVLLMGNESHGISRELSEIVSQTITIPRYGGAESLNVGVATAVICDNIRRG